MLALNVRQQPSDEGVVGNQSSLTTMLQEAVLLSEDIFDLQQVGICGIFMRQSLIYSFQDNVNPRFNQSSTSQTTETFV